jgi:RNA polymerase sigma-70 factor (ECF subfamily)
MSTPVLDVTQSLVAARAGSRDSLGMVLDACRGYLLKIAEQELDADLRGKLGASDVVQQTMMNAVRGFDGFHGVTEAELLAWLRKLLLNNVISATRLYVEASKRQVSREISIDAGNSSGAGNIDPSAGASTPSGQAIGREERDAVARAIERLPDDYRRVLHLRYEEGRSFEEIGDLMGLTANAARKLWVRTIKRLQLETDE